MATNNKAVKLISKLAINAARKKTNGFSRNAERLQLSINKCQSDIEKLEAKKDPLVSFALQRKKDELIILESKFSILMRKHKDARGLLLKYTSHNNSIGNNGKS